MMNDSQCCRTAETGAGTPTGHLLALPEPSLDRCFLDPTTLLYIQQRGGTTHVHVTPNASVWLRNAAHAANWTDTATAPARPVAVTSKDVTSTANRDIFKAFCTKLQAATLVGMLTHVTNTSRKQPRTSAGEGHAAVSQHLPAVALGGSHRFQEGNHNPPCSQELPLSQLSLSIRLIHLQLQLCWTHWNFGQVIKIFMALIFVLTGVWIRPHT